MSRSSVTDFTTLVKYTWCRHVGVRSWPEKVHHNNKQCSNVKNYPSISNQFIGLGGLFLMSQFSGLTPSVEKFC